MQAVWTAWMRANPRAAADAPMLIESSEQAAPPSTPHKAQEQHPTSGLEMGIHSRPDLRKSPQRLFFRGVNIKKLPPLARTPDPKRCINRFRRFTDKKWG